MNKVINKVLNWFLRSSDNPDEVAMTVKGIILLYGGHVISSLSTIGITINNEVYVHDVSIAVTVLGAVLTAIGAIRKIVLTAKNQ